MHRILKNTGSIYLQMDWRIVHWIRQVADDVFGYDNFRNEIIWEYPTPAKSKTYVHNTDKILFYTKTNIFTFNNLYDSLAEKSIKRIEPYLFTDIDGKQYYYRGRNLKDSQYVRKIRSREFVIGNNLLNLFTKIEYRGKKLGEVWRGLTSVSQGTERVYYDTQKPFALMERIIKVSSNEGDLVADFFMGSGSFLVKAKEPKRHYIGCDTNKRALEITNQRLIY